MLGKRQTVNVVVQGSTQIVPHPLTNAGCQIFLEVRAHGPNNRNECDRRYGKVQNCIVVLTEEPSHNFAQASREFIRRLYVVDDDLEWPRLKNVRECLAQYRH